MRKSKSSSRLMLSKVIVLRAAKTYIFRYGWYTSGHVTKMAVTPICRGPKPHAARKPNGSVFYRTGVCAINVYIAGIGILDLFSFCELDLDPMMYLTHITWSYM